MPLLLILFEQVRRQEEDRRQQVRRNEEVRRQKAFDEQDRIKQDQLKGRKISEPIFLAFNSSKKWAEKNA